MLGNHGTLCQNGVFLGPFSIQRSFNLVIIIIIIIIINLFIIIIIISSSDDLFLW